MNESSDVSGKRNQPWTWLGSVILFGVLMALRAELHSIWLRALAGGIAFGFLIPAIQGFRRKNDSVKAEM